MTQTIPIFDLAQIEENWGGAEDETYRTILGIFASEAETLLAGLARGTAQGDHAAVKRLAHTLRGAASNIAALRIVGSAGALEHAPPDTSPAALAALLDKVAGDVSEANALIAAGGPHSR